MGIFRRKVPSHLIRIHPDNTTNKDWVILLESGTIVGPSPERLRVARSTLERKIVRKYNILLRAEHFLVVEGYDPRIHAVYFCPQLYKYDPDKKLVPLQGEEIGRLIAHALEGGITERRPWYEPSEELPNQPIISTPALQCRQNLIPSLLKCRVRETPPSELEHRAQRARDKVEDATCWRLQDHCPYNDCRAKLVTIRQECARGGDFFDSECD